MPETDLYKAIKYSSDIYSFWKNGPHYIHRILNTPLFNYWIDLIDNALEEKSQLKF